MSVRNFLTLIAIFLSVGVAVWLAQLNGQVVTVDLPGLPPLASPLWLALGSTFLAGVFVALLYSLAVSSREAWRRRARSRGEPVVGASDAVRQGAEAVLRSHFTEARRLLEAAARRRPEDAHGWRLAGDAALAAGDAAAARELHLRARGLAPDDPEALRALSRDAEALGDLDAARSWLQQCIDGDGATPADRIRLRDLHVRAGRWDEAIAAQREILAGTDEPARRQVERRCLSGLRVSRARARLAVAEGESRHPDVITDLEALTRDDPDFLPGWLALADARRKARGEEGVVTTLEEGYAATGALEALRRLVVGYLEADRPEAAIRVLEDASVEQGARRGLAVRIMLGRLYQRLGLKEEAREVFDRIADETRWSPLVDFHRAKLRAGDGHYQAAYDLLHNSLQRVGIVADRYACAECDALHDDWADRCATCDGWGTLRLAVARDVHPLEEVVAPRV